LHFFYVVKKQSRHHEISDIGIAMRVGLMPFGLAALIGLSACGSIQNSSQEQPKISIQLDAGEPAKSEGTLKAKPTPVTFQVGYGRYGIACADTSFREGETPLGTFKVNAILTPDRFEMVPALVKQSGKSEAYLKENLFKNMSAIDFKGDGETGEYGDGYISLEPLSDTEQPFRFNEYDGKFRWYSFAIHGTNNKSRVGQKVTGGCINVDDATMATLLKNVKLGDEVVVSSDGPCNE
jgi:hypothetical protein|tara:strand:+ start:147 stop:857 length:711 start_codon:yes stop_codon:yes gene_type:complete